ncbi:MAG TPA: DUF4157 domain-containing protein [Thermoanaerobaculia bacterium]|jgi:hypothetical protein
MQSAAVRTNAASCEPSGRRQQRGTDSPTPVAASRFSRDLSRIPAGSLQRKLTVGAAGDTHEQEADRVAATVMRKSDSCGCGGKCGSCAEGTTAPLVQKRDVGGSAHGVGAAPPIVHDVIGTAGQPLDASARTFMESRFGRPLDVVRVHTGPAAAESARSVHARAYTVGRHMVFGANQYAPHSSSGRELIAHELAHVMQQGGGDSSVVQRAEVDDRSCAGLTDIESDVDTKVNKELADARKAAGTPPPLKDFVDEAIPRLAGSSPIGPIESFIEGLGATKAEIPPSSLAGTKYSGVDAVNKFYKLHTLGVAHVVGSHSLIHGICVGADKVGHFFQQGLDYARVVASSKATSNATKVAEAESAGRALEIGLQGLSSTGVYSNADQSANRAGLDFWADLVADHTKYKFAIKNYITAKWNEQSNPSFYEKSVGGVVWSNLLAGDWKGPFTSGGGKGFGSPIDSHVKLSATASSVTGSYEWPAAKPTNKGTLTGKITQRTTAVSGTLPGKPAVSDTPVSGVQIDFDWKEGTANGKGVWSSVDEQNLDGTWGVGPASSGAGLWTLKKS